MHSVMHLRGVEIPQYSLGKLVFPDTAECSHGTRIKPVVLYHPQSYSLKGNPHHKKQYVYTHSAMHVRGVANLGIHWKYLYSLQLQNAVTEPL